MQRTARGGAGGIDRPGRLERCPECGAPIGGIEATAPGGHRFADCGHRADGRFLVSPLAAESTLVGIRTG